MLTGILFLTGSALLGLAIIRCTSLRSILNHAEQVIWGIVSGWMLTTLFAYFMARLLGQLTFRSLLWLILAVWLAAALLLFARLRQLKPSRSLWQAEYGGLALVLALFAPIFLMLFATRMLAPGAGGVYSGGSTFFDLGFHLAIASSFLYGQNLPPIYTPFPPAPLLYPFLPDFQMAVLGALGMNWRAALLWTGIPLALAITGLLYSFARQVLERSDEGAAAFSRSHVAAALATILFLLNGGLGFVYFFGDWRQSGKSLAAFWSQLGTNYANMGEQRIVWTNFIVDTLLPQRTSLFGYAIALMVFTLFAVVWRKWFDAEAKDSGWDGWQLLLIGGVLTGMTPRFHAHVYLGLGLISGFLFMLRPRRQWLAFWLPGVLLAFPYLSDLASHVAAKSFMRFQPGWRGHSERFWIWFWLRNIGLPALLIFPAWWSADQPWRRFYLAFAALLVFSLLIIVSPNEYDNIKLIYLWYAPTAVLVAAWLVRLAEVHKQRLLAAVLTLVCMLAGLMALQYEGSQHNLIFTNDELTAANFAREHTSANSLFLTAPTVHQPILSLAGRAILRGDTAWLWSHGYDFAQREADVKLMYAGAGEAIDLINYYGVDYIYLGSREKEQLHANQEFFDNHFPAVYRGADVTIYEARKNHNSQLQPLEWLPPREFASRLDKDPYQLLSQFSDVGYALYRMYQTAFARRPRYAEFIEDMKTLGRGVYAGAPGWQEVLEKNKDAIAEQWLTRNDFQELYATKSNEQFVDALLGNSGLTARDVQRAELISRLDKGQSRALVLRSLAASARPDKHDYNAAYILLHYFAYLRRNPDDPPDNNLKGFNFWLGDLDKTGDYRSVDRVFIESGEYKDRVIPR